MIRLRLKADGRVVELLPDGVERPLPRGALEPTAGAAQEGAVVPSAAYARGLRTRLHLTQAEFAARIGVPIETVRTWEQGKREPRGPARALLKVIENAPEVAFAVLGAAKPAA